MDVFYSIKSTGPSKALKLGSKKKDVDSFAAQIQLEGESKYYSNNKFFENVSKC